MQERAQTALAEGRQNGGCLRVGRLAERDVEGGDEGIAAAQNGDTAAGRGAEFGGRVAAECKIIQAQFVQRRDEFGGFRGEDRGVHKPGGCENGGEVKGAAQRQVRQAGGAGRGREGSQRGDARDTGGVLVEPGGGEIPEAGGRGGEAEAGAGEAVELRVAGAKNFGDDEDFGVALLDGGDQHRPDGTGVLCALRR